MRGYARMNAEQAADPGKYLDELYEHWVEIRKETIEQLGGREGLKIVDFHGNNWIDIVRWISSEYKKEEQMSIVSFQFSRLFKEIYWLQFLFHTGNYPTAYRNLRYILEMICQAYYIDTKYPTLTLDEQIGKAMEIEKRLSSWNIVSNALCKVFNRAEREIRAHFKPLWDDLNKYAHPSAKQMDLIAEQDFSALVTDSFNENLARELLAVTDKVFDIVYAVILKRFPKSVSLAQKYEFIDEWQECLPNTIAIMRQ
jgi:hypothetical protein